MIGQHLKRFRLVIAAVVLSLGVSAAPASGANSHQLIVGTGSSWATNALNVWIAGVASNGLRVVFTSTGSGTGRKDFGNSTNDFAVSDIGYQGHDPQNGDVDLPCKLGGTSDCRPYAYLPIVAGGTSFPYHLTVAGKLVRNLRLSGKTLALIFTGKIRKWNDPAIKADNNGRIFPALPIIPVNHSEPSGSSAQFTTYLDTQYPAIWRGYTGKPGETEYFPNSPNAIAQSGSDGVMNFITSASANGSIGYDEYSYALANDYPVAKIENSAGYFTLPTQYNVAVALTKAQINEDKKSPNYLIQNLKNVYSFNDPRTYPLSSYSYMIIPTSPTDSRMNTAKRQTLADFIYYSVCQGQAQVGPVGYSALPLNLVQASFEQTGKLKTADPAVNLTKRDVTTCNNPTFVAGNLSANHLAQIAPQPPACDKSGAGPCVGDGDSGTTGVPVSSGGSNNNGSTGGSNGGSSGGSSGTGNGSTSTGGTSNGTTAPGGAAATGGAVKAGGSRTGGTTAPGASQGGANSNVKINPDTGQVDTSTTGDDNGGASAVSVDTELTAYRQMNLTNVLAPLAALEILTALALPPLVYYAILRRRRR